MTRAFSPKALLFDLNGTMIDDMHYHLKVWHSILNEDLSAGLSLDEVRSQMYGNNRDLLERVFGAGAFTVEELDRISRLKEERYQAIYKPHMKLLPGLEQLLLKAAQKKIPIAIGSAAIPFNIDFVLDNLKIRHFFDVIVSAEDVMNSKPDPETYLKAAAGLKVAPTDCLVFEDAPKGAEAAERAGMATIAITTLHDHIEFKHLTNIMMFVKDYTDARISSLL